MLKTKIQFLNNQPVITVDGKPCSPLAYTTYFDECGEWTDFINHGYRIFFVNISFNDLPINNVTGFSPFRSGVFEGSAPDYAYFDEIVNDIITQCPDALIFPRIHISMPRKWLEQNPTETVTTPSGVRESLYSDKFKHDGAELLKAMLGYFKSAPYSHHIAGYQLCGGTTQEWFHHDLFGSYSDMGMAKFRKWANEKYGITYISIPTKDALQNGEPTDEVSKYYEFCSEESTRTIEHFARVTKECTNSEQIVGVFYGYNAYVSDPLWGTHGLSNIIDSPYIDFFSSPCCYDFCRQLGFDWGDMLPVDSLKLHGKLCFIECDIRTHLTRRMQDSRPNRYPDTAYGLYDANGNKTVWCGPDTPEGSISALYKAFGRQITKSSGIWWFDMWGGWYHHDKIMAELENMRRIYEKVNGSSHECLRAEVALFIDEKAYKNIPRGNPMAHMVNHIREKLGATGIPFDVYMVEDAQRVIERYKVAIFTAPYPSDEGHKALELCKRLNIPYIPAREPHSAEELRKAITALGVHCYNSDNCVIYCGNGILGVHTANDGEAKITLPKVCKVNVLYGADVKDMITDTITLNLPRHSTAIFEII